MADTRSMNDGRPRPILSSLADDPRQQESIEAFVLGLAEQIDDLQESEVQGDFRRVAELAVALQQSAAEAGYEVLSRCATGVRATALDESPEDTRKALIEVTEVAHRVRIGYRGSV